MPTVTVELPSLLVNVVGADRTQPVEAASVRGALRELIARHPGVETHLFDERGELREHVLCLHNQANTRWSGTLDGPVAEGDVITILQAVSGG